MHLSLAKLTSAATLALAALPSLALTTTAFAAPATIHIGDLDFSRASDVARFEKRVAMVGETMCATDRLNQTAWRSACEAEVRREAIAALPNHVQRVVAAEPTQIAALR